MKSLLVHHDAGGLMHITGDCAVALDYTMTDTDGNEILSTKGREPYMYLHGHGQIVRGLEKMLSGKTVGDAVSVTLPPEEAYGPRDDMNITVLPREDFNDDELVIGNRVHIMSMQGPRMVTVKSFNDEEVVLDTNHELAGKTLHFDVTILKVRKATRFELGCGHVHAPV